MLRLKKLIAPDKESEIVESWKYTDKVYISFICTTYNQEAYICDALDGMLAQETDHRFEVIVHDDASSDNTVDILIDYQKRFPNIIKLILQRTNQYSQGKRVMLLAAKEASAKYLAVCEGDDYWINSKKVQKQYDFIVNNSCSLVFSPSYIENNGKIEGKEICYYGSKVKKFTAQDVLNVQNQFAPTASYFVKKEVLISALEVFKNAPVADLFIEVYAGLKEGIYYLPEVGSIYRVNAINSWTRRMNSNYIANKIEFVKGLEMAVNSVDGYDEFKDLDWGVKFSVNYLSMAKECLRISDYKNFRSNIITSYRYGRISWKQILLYRFRSFSFFLRYLILLGR